MQQQITQLGEALVQASLISPDQLRNDVCELAHVGHDGSHFPDVLSVKALLDDQAVIISYPIPGDVPHYVEESCLESRQ